MNRGCGRFQPNQLEHVAQEFCHLAGLLLDELSENDAPMRIERVISLRDEAARSGDCGQRRS